MQTGDFVSIDFVGRVKDRRKFFALPLEKTEKKKIFFNPKIKYEPITVVVGAGFVITALDDAMKEMKIGERKTIEVEPAKGFGERKPELVRLIPLSSFKDQN